MTRESDAARAAAALARFQALHPRVIDLSLGRIEALLAKLGNPERRLPPTVHFAGTNGKGSTLAFLRAGLEAAGACVHAYISPHLVRFNERIVLAGADIADPALADLVEEVEAANAGAEITFFEITTAAAFLAYSRTPADVLLMETGLGGRLDATNVVARPRLTCITPISHDHKDFLGDSLTGIAAEKAGILKPGVPAVIAAQVPAVQDVLADRAAALKAPLSCSGRDWTAEPADFGMRFRGKHWRLALPMPALAGAHQIGNAGTALACMQALPEFGLTPVHARRALAEARWPARLQRLRQGPLVDLLPDHWTLWLDGGHNVDAAQALARWIANRERPVDLVVGMLKTKDARGFLDAVLPWARNFRAVPVPASDAGLDPANLVQLARQAGLPASADTGPRDAIAQLIRPVNEPADILICGSLYLAGDVLRDNA
jgi:dihydrofolate synthase/folylpolyglutamate synthase